MPGQSFIVVVRPRDQQLPGPSMNELCRQLFRPQHVVSTRPSKTSVSPPNARCFDQDKTPLFLPWVPVGTQVFIRYAARVCCAMPYAGMLCVGPGYLA
ncbi:hypothetical protein C4D60_Mb00t02320 [Musa balbisiana]|uniref:Uncharacterized protein n=1 Tax=Musa balbisiana TaxID=52838 RepID=A0A4S8I6T8_MUSBA|nr:hypothetical protein C4D60_Mb00t02320 [Musa balbisiana]